MESEILTTLRHVGCKVWMSNDNLVLTIRAIVAQRQQGNVDNSPKQCLLRNLPSIFAVFSDNVEFGLIENGFQWMPPKLFDVSNRLLWLFQRVIMDVPDFFTKQMLPFPHETIQYLTSLEAHIVTPKHLETLCHLSRTQLTALFVTYKNQLPYLLSHVLLTKFCKNSQYLCIADFEIVLKFLPSLVQTNEHTIHSRTNDNLPLREVCRENCWISPKFQDRKIISESINPFLENYFSSVYLQWRLGRNIFYLLSRPFDGKKKISKDTFTLPFNKNLTCEMICALMHCFCIPVWLYRASQSYIFYRVPFLEYTSLQGYVIQDILLDLRRCCYGILCSSTASIKEIGRSSDNFKSTIYCYPIALPHYLKLENVFKLNHNVHDNGAWLNYTRDFVITFLSYAGKKNHQLRHMNITLLKLYFYVLCALQWCYEKDKKKHDCFLKHEIHSLIASIIVTAGESYECNNEWVPELSDARDCVKKVYHKLFKNQFIYPVQDPGQQCFTTLTQGNPNVHRIALYGLIPGFRSTFLFGFFQIVWEYLVDVSNMYQCMTRKNSDKLNIPPSLLFNGTIFRWMYAAGALQWKDRKTSSNVQMCLMLKSPPIHIHSTCQTQIKWIQLFRSQLLKTSLFNAFRLHV
ncbi:uncharacterized protein LOC128883512 isoform X2 [Hylaeus volcanicus]|uniref:uncharacterized protein LOC128883512 isoform X2 n=1 Tax=Hylaeus volcanicus TaxID=313075 RepID=UPI0023B8034B|nr:uncharacterized protein LOC128883512 isoform X2 [Hylaeus volcanicus]